VLQSALTILRVVESLSVVVIIIITTIVIIDIRRVVCARHYDNIYRCTIRILSQVLAGALGHRRNKVSAEQQPVPRCINKKPREPIPDPLPTNVRVR